MKKRKSLLLTLCTIVLMSMCCFLTACLNVVTITNIAKTSTSGLVDNYTIYYSDGTTYEFAISNGKDGVDGVDGEDVTILDIYNNYVDEYGDISYADFLEKYLQINLSDNSLVINKCLLSSMQIYSEFTTSSYYGYGPYQTVVKSISHSCGSAVIYKVEEDYTYILTNYHVVFNKSANDDCENGIAYNIYGYIYGSENTPVESSKTDSNGYTIYDYGDYGISLEYVGGSIDYDIAILKTPTNKMTAINESIMAVEVADDYHVGETAIAIGNPENEGISVSEGIISVDNEFINLAIDNTTRSYRSIRIDTAIYSGSSGGGLFNNRGELIGITNAGDTSDQNINYAIPIDIVKNVANNIIYYYDGDNISTVKKITLGITITTENTKYEYNAETGYGEITEDVIISSVIENSIASEMGVLSGDKITSIVVNDKSYKINRYFDIGDIILSIREGDVIEVKYNRDGANVTTSSYTITSSHLS